MKKLLLAVVALVSVFCLAFSAAGCKPDEAVQGDSRERITLGLYPQSMVSDTETELTEKLKAQVGSLPSSSDDAGWTTYGYNIDKDSEPDYMWYKDVTIGEERYRGVYFTHYRPDSASKNGSAENSYQDENGFTLNRDENGELIQTVYWFKFEPVTWCVLETNNGKSLVVADCILDSQAFCLNVADNANANKYAMSDIKAWLNGTFFDTAFSEAEQGKIVADDSLGDNVFLLSHDDVINSAYGFSTDNKAYDSMRQAACTSYAMSQGALCANDYKNNGIWWLRSPVDTDETGASVVNVGSINYFGRYDDTRLPDSTHCGVRPAMWIQR